MEKLFFLCKIWGKGIVNENADNRWYHFIQLFTDEIGAIITRLIKLTQLLHVGIHFSYFDK
jgi:hypothetical protein